MQMRSFLSGQYGSAPYTVCTASPAVRGKEVRSGVSECGVEEGSSQEEASAVLCRPGKTHARTGSHLYDAGLIHPVGGYRRLSDGGREWPEAGPPAEQRTCR